MDQGSNSQTTRTEPPKYQLPYLQHGVQEARNLYNSSAPRVAPMSDTSSAALGGIAAQARNNQLSPAASNLATNTLNGGMLGTNPFLQSGPNPHLDATFNQAALATQNQLGSQFARSGRDQGASQGLRAQQLGDLATNIYGGAYENDQNRRLSAYSTERGLQQGALGMSPMLSQAQYGDLDRLLGVGQTFENYQQRQLDAPGNALDQYLGRVSGNMGSNVTVNGGGGGFSGAGAMGGAMMGNQMFGGWGALGGGLLGGFF